MALGGSSLSSYVRRQRDYFNKKVDPDLIVNALADAFIAELEQVTPGPGKHPNATGNLLRAVTAKSEVMQSGYFYYIGVGDLDRLGHRGEKSYEPQPIKRFLDWYRQQAAEEYQQRREREAEAARGVAERRAERLRIRAEREKALYGHAAGIEELSAKQEEVLMRLSEKFAEMIRRYDRMTEADTNYEEFFAHEEQWQDADGKWHGWDYGKESYRIKKGKWLRLLDRQKQLYHAMEQLEDRIARLAELLMKFMAGG
jgi:hypothetical protein